MPILIFLSCFLFKRVCLLCLKDFQVVRFSRLHYVILFIFPKKRIQFILQYLRKDHIARKIRENNKCKQMTRSKPFSWIHVMIFLVKIRELDPGWSLMVYICHVHTQKNLHMWYVNVYCRCRNYRTEVEEYEGTVIYRTLLFYNSVFLGRCEKKTYLNLLLTFFVVL